GVGTGLAIAAGLAFFLFDFHAVRALYFASAVLVSIGLFFVFLKIGRQTRFWRAVSRPQTSWMTRELYAAMVFYPAVLASLVAPGPLPFAVASASAAAFLLCQAKILHRARGVPAWRAPLIPWMIGASGLLEGWGAFAVASFLLQARASSALAAVGVALALASAILWRTYVATRSEEHT